MSIFTTDEEIKERLDSENNVLFKQIGPTGRRNGDKGLSQEAQVSIGVMANLIGGKAVSEIIPVSQPQADNLKKGIISPPNGVNVELKEKIDQKLEDKVKPIIDLTLEKMIKTIGKVDENDLDVSSKAAKVSKDLSTIHANLTRKDEGGNQVQVNIVAYAPRQKTLDDYETVELPKPV